MQTLIILGRQPKIGLAELESLYGANVLAPVGDQAVLLDIEPAKVDFARLGGFVKFCKVLTGLKTTNWSEIKKYLIQTVPQHLGYLPEGKLTFGLSVYGLGVDSQTINKTALEVKKVIRSAGKSARVVPNDKPALNSAKVLHNKLNSPQGWELVFVKNESETILAQTIAVQDIEAYTKRDRGRPKRDLRVGMLPPKLAQIIINLAVGKLDPEDPAFGPAQPKGQAALDPFCGTGTVLMEAALMGYDSYGSDIELRMIDYSKTNLDWLGEKLTHPPFSYLIEQGDATKHQWDKSFDFVASEAYLGRHFAAPPKPDALKQTISDVNTIIKKFLKNLASQTKSGFRLCIALPAWKTSNGFKHLPCLDSLEELGYNRLSFTRTGDEDLIYHREGQIVGRELVVLQRA